MNEGEELSLKCHVMGSSPLTVQWMKDRRELKSSGNTKITFVDGTARLQIKSTSKTDAGDYLCKASNATGSDFCKCRVTVKGNQVVSFMSFGTIMVSFQLWCVRLCFNVLTLFPLPPFVFRERSQGSSH